MAIMEKIEGYNPRYLAYCKAHGHEDDVPMMLVQDEKRWPGGKMAGFMLWIRARLNEFYEAHPEACPLLREEHHDAFDTWLKGVD